MTDDFVTDFGRDLRAAAHRHAHPVRRARPWALRLAAVAAVAVLVVTLVRLPGPREREAAPEVPAATTVGPPAPVADLPHVFGSRSSTPLDQGFLGHLTLVTFGAPWCGPCVRDLPAQNAARRELKGSGGTVRYVVTKDTGRDARAMTVPDGLRTALVLDRDGDYARAWKVRALPVSALVDAHGRIVARRRGRLDVRWLRDRVAGANDRGRSEMAGTTAAFAVLRDPSTVVPTPRSVARLSKDSLAGTAGGETYLVFSHGTDRMWALLTPRGTCTLTRSRRGGGGGCGPYSDAFRTGRTGPSYTVAGRGIIRLETLVPDGTHAARAHLSDGSVRAVRIHDNVIFERVPDTIRRLTWIAPDGTRQSFRIS